jgi:8-oxo-dGTP diphosphatase
MSYNYKYPRPALTVDCVILRNEKNHPELLLIQRDHYPFEEMWALPGGFIEMDETLLESASRELMEETGLTGIQLIQYKAFDKIDRDPRGRTISVIFYGSPENPLSPVKAASDARDAKWFRIDNLPELAFDHAEIIDSLVNEKLIP